MHVVCAEKASTETLLFKDQYIHRILALHFKLISKNVQQLSSKVHLRSSNYLIGSNINGSNL